MKKLPSGRRTVFQAVWWPDRASQQRRGRSVARERERERERERGRGEEGKREERRKKGLHGGLNP
jgi:hypothetical protein